MKNNRFVVLNFEKATLAVYEGRKVIAKFETDKPVVIFPEQIKELRTAEYKEPA